MASVDLPSLTVNFTLKSVLEVQGAYVGVQCAVRVGVDDLMDEVCDVMDEVGDVIDEDGGIMG